MSFIAFTKWFTGIISQALELFPFQVLFIDCQRNSKTIQSFEIVLCHKLGL